MTMSKTQNTPTHTTYTTHTSAHSDIADLRIQHNYTHNTDTLSSHISITPAYTRHTHTNTPTNTGHLTQTAIFASLIWRM